MNHGPIIIDPTTEELQRLRRLSDAFELVFWERRRQERHVSNGRFRNTAAAPGLADQVRLAVLAEELGEIAEVTPALTAKDAKGYEASDAGTLRLLLVEHVLPIARRLNDGQYRDPETLPPAAPYSEDRLKEAVQVAAVAIAWLEGILADDAAETSRIIDARRREARP